MTVSGKEETNYYKNLQANPSAIAIPNNINSALRHHYVKETGTSSSPFNKTLSTNKSKLSRNQQIQLNQQGRIKKAKLTVTDRLYPKSVVAKDYMYKKQWQYPQPSGEMTLKKLRKMTLTGDMAETDYDEWVQYPCSVAQLQKCAD